jgi:D-3-phosphoglycerate dehydrogenase
MDVFVAEPVESTNRFLELDNVAVSPHIGGETQDVVRHQSEMIVEDIELFIKGKRPKNVKNPEVLQKGKATKKKKPASRSQSDRRRR